MKTIYLPLLFFTLLMACNSDQVSDKKHRVKKDSVKTDETDVPVIDEVEMEYVYEVTDSKTKKTKVMSQEEYLESGIWENPDYVIKEVPVVK